MIVSSRSRAPSLISTENRRSRPSTSAKPSNIVPSIAHFGCDSRVSTILIESRRAISRCEVLLDSVHGGVGHVRVGGGRIFARNCVTNLDVTVIRRTLTLAYDWLQHDKLAAQVNVGQGNAWLSLPSDARFHLLARAPHGKIANDFNNLSVSANSSGSEMKIDQTVNGGGAATINVRVDKGNIKIAEANP